jgi:gas vesicle protein
MHLEQYEPQTSSWRGSILMFVAGTAVGAVTALLMAPASGRDSRDYIRRQSRKMASDVTSQADRLASAVKWGSEQATTAVRETMDSAVSQAKAAYSAARTQRQGDGATASASPSASSMRPSQPRPMTTSPS